MNGQTFNLNQDFMNNYTSIFTKIIIAIIVVYAIVTVINFLRDKYVNKAMDTLNSDYLELLLLLHKIFVISGWGFIIGNMLQIPLKLIRPNKNNLFKNLQGDYDYLIFGVIIIFIGIGCNKAKQAIETYRKQKENN